MRAYYICKITPIGSTSLTTMLWVAALEICTEQSQRHMDSARLLVSQGGVSRHEGWRASSTPVNSGFQLWDVTSRTRTAKEKTQRTKSQRRNHPEATSHSDTPGQEVSAPPKMFFLISCAFSQATLRVKALPAPLRLPPQPQSTSTQKYWSANSNGLVWAQKEQFFQL